MCSSTAPCTSRLRRVARRVVCCGLRSRWRTLSAGSTAADGSISSTRLGQVCLSFVPPVGCSSRTGALWRVTKRPKGSDCKSDCSAFGGSNPSLATMGHSRISRILFSYLRRPGHKRKATENPVAFLVFDANRSPYPGRHRYPRSRSPGISPRVPRRTSQRAPTCTADSRDGSRQSEREKSLQHVVHGCPCSAADTQTSEAPSRMST